MKTLADEFYSKLPSNFKEHDRPFFEPHFQNPLYTPEVISIKNAFFFKYGMIYDIGIKPVKQNLPWDKVAQNFGKRYFIKTSLKHLFNNDIGFLVASKIKYCIATNTFSDNFYHWFTEVIPKLITLKRELGEVVILLPDIYNKAYQIETFKLLKIKYYSLKKELSFIKKVYIVSRESDYISYYSKLTLRTSNSLLSPQSLVKQSSYNKI